MRFIIGLIIGLAIVPVAVYFYFSLGFAPVATDSPPMPFEQMLADKALDARVAKEMPRGEPPVAPTDENLIAGAKAFGEHCAGCHGKLDKPPSIFAKSLFPRPPWLLDPEHPVDDPPAAVYWVVSNGIRLTAMPAFKNLLSDDERWQISQMLTHAQKLPAAAQAALKGPQPQ